MDRLPDGETRRPCRDESDGEFVRCFACTRKGHRAIDIDPPAWAPTLTLFGANTTSWQKLR